MGGLGAPELLVVFVVVLLVFGPRKIPEVARGIGVAMRELRRLTVEFQRELNLAEALDERKSGSSPRPPGPPPGVARIDPNAPRPRPASSPADSPLADGETPTGPPEAGVPPSGPGSADHPASEAPEDARFPEDARAAADVPAPDDAPPPERAPASEPPSEDKKRND